MKHLSCPLAAALYVILKPISRYLALLGALFRLAFAMSWVLSAINLLGALRLLGSTPYLQVFEADRLQVLARLTIAATFDDYYVGLPFFGLAATVCAYLWIKSNYIPRGLAIYGFVASAWCVLCAYLFLIFPDFNKIVNDYLFDSPMALFELGNGLSPICSSMTSLPAALRRRATARTSKAVSPVRPRAN